MIQTFRDCWGDLALKASHFEMVRFWVRKLADMAFTALILHTRRWIMPASMHYAFLRPWGLLQHASRVNRWLARFRPYPKPFRTPLQFAWYEAKAYSSPRIQPEHILLGVLRATKSVRRHLAPAVVESAIAVGDAHAGHGRGLPGNSAFPDPAVNAFSQQVIARAMETAALRRQRLSRLHLLLALREERGGIVSECFDAMGMDQLWIERELQAG
jgi:hypothetical protein